MNQKTIPRPRQLCIVCKHHPTERDSKTCKGQKCKDYFANFHKKLLDAGMDPEWARQWVDCNHDWKDDQVLVYATKPVYENDRICSKCNIRKSHYDRVMSCLQ